MLNIDYSWFLTNGMVRMTENKLSLINENIVKRDLKIFVSDYSHELQTCDWPRNVGCVSDVGEGQNRALDVDEVEEEPQRVR